MCRLIIKYALFVAAGSLFMSGSAMAERQVDAVTLTPMVGYHVIDGGMSLEDSAAFGFGVGYNFSSHWSIETVFSYTPTETDTDNSTDVDIWTGSLGGIYHFKPMATLSPYLSFGAGIMSYEHESGSNDEDGFGYYGGGINYALTKSTDLRFDARHMLDYRTDSGGSKHDDTDWRHHLQTMVGVSYQFGAPPVVAKKEPLSESGVKSESKPPVDTDRDGIFTPLDLCPETAPGVRVDDDGCPADTDGDGVEDFRDACVDTPKGVKVDSRGCPEPVKKIIFLTRDITFGFDKDKVTPFHYKELARISEIIEEYPGYTVLVEGHADDTGTVEYNQELSERRAESIREALVGRYGIDDDRIGTVGFGLTRPIAGNETAEERMKNRRVEITIHP